jgi:hypothetical protein
MANPFIGTLTLSAALAEPHDTPGMTSGQPTLTFGFVVIGTGLLLMAWGFCSRPIKRQRGLRKKLSMLFSDGLEGPDQSMRVFFTGLAALLIGGTAAISNLAPKMTAPVFLTGWVLLVALALLTLYLKYDRPRIDAKPRSNRRFAEHQAITDQREQGE